MVKSDLKTGMLVKFRNEGYGFVFGFSIVSFNRGGLEMSHYSDDLKCINYDSEYDIMEINSVPNLSGAGLDWWIDNQVRLLSKVSLLWKRYETKETVKIGGITYDKSEFEAAVKNLKPINK